MDCSLPGSSVHGILHQEHCSGAPVTYMPAYLSRGAHRLVVATVVCALSGSALNGPGAHSPGSLAVKGKSRVGGELGGLFGLIGAVAGFLYLGLAVTLWLHRC